MNLKVRAKINLTTILKAIALLVSLSILLRGWIDIDGTYDTWGYHLPFAARIWGIVPGEQFIHMEERFRGFPLLGEFLQGGLWFMTQRVQAANLVGFICLLIYCYFLNSYFRVPYYLTLLSLLGVPLIQAHAVNCYVDLMGNLFLAMTIIMAYLLYKEARFPSRRDLLVIFGASFAASNTKPQLEPLVFLVLVFIVVRLVWWQWRRKQLPFNSASRSQLFTWLVKVIPVTLVASLLIFATPVKNIVVHGNPFYPVRIEIAGKILNHALPMYSDAPGYLADAPKAQRWLYSILDLNSAYWTHDQYSPNPNRNRMGGFFGAYVVFQVILLLYLIIRHPHPDTYSAGIVVIVMSAIAANFPQSHELRYFMYWMITLISLNLILITQYPVKLLTQSRLGLVALGALIIVGIKTNFVYLYPRFVTLEVFKDKRIDPTVLLQIQPGDQICLPNREPFTFGYTSWFHPQLNYTYSIRSAFLEPCASTDQIIPLK